MEKELESLITSLKSELKKAVNLCTITHKIIIMKKNFTKKPNICYVREEISGNYALHIFVSE